MLTFDQLTDIIAQGEQLDGKFKSERHNMVFYGLTEYEISVMEGKL